MKTQFQPTPKAEWDSMILKPGVQELKCQPCNRQLPGLENRHTVLEVPEEHLFIFRLGAWLGAPCVGMMRFKASLASHLYHLSCVALNLQPHLPEPLSFCYPVGYGYISACMLVR